MIKLGFLYLFMFGYAQGQSNVPDSPFSVCNDHFFETQLTSAELHNFYLHLKNWDDKQVSFKQKRWLLRNLEKLHKNKTDHKRFFSDAEIEDFIESLERGFVPNDKSLQYWLSIRVLMDRLSISSDDVILLHRRIEDQVFDRKIFDSQIMKRYKKKFNSKELESIYRAHRVGLDQIENLDDLISRISEDKGQLNSQFGLVNSIYRLNEIKSKLKILKEAGISDSDAKMLLKNGDAGLLGFLDDFFKAEARVVKKEEVSESDVDYLKDLFGKEHSYSRPTRTATNYWQNHEIPPKAFINFKEITPYYSYPAFTGASGKKVIIDEISGEEILSRSKLDPADAGYIDLKNVSGVGFYHGTDVSFETVNASGGFRLSAEVEYIDNDLFHHTAGSEGIAKFSGGTPLAGKTIRSNFMGSTLTPLDMTRESSWGKYIYDFRGVPGWDIQANAHLATKELEKSLLKNIAGEREIALPRDIPIWCVLRVATTSETSSGRTIISRWDVNKFYDSAKCRKFFGK